MGLMPGQIFQSANKTNPLNISVYLQMFCASRGKDRFGTVVAGKDARMKAHPRLAIHCPIHCMPLQSFAQSAYVWP